MGGIREVQFVVGPETSTQPTGVDPSDDADLVTKGYGDETYAKRISWYDDKANITEVRSILSSELHQGTRVFIDGNQTDWYYNDSSIAADDGTTTLKPNDVDPGDSGRWLILSGTGSSAGGATSSIESLTQKLIQEHYDVNTAPLDNSVGSGFGETATSLVGTLLDAYSSGTTAYLAWNPKYINDSDKNTDSATGWSAQGAAASLAASNTAGDFKIGTHGLKFDKNNSATNARIRYDVGGVTKGINGFTELLFWIKFPSITNLSNVEVRIDVDGTNYQTYTATTDNTGASFTANWHLIKIDLTTAGSTSGTGWDKSKLFRYLHIGVNTSSGAQTYTGIVVDAVHFSIYNPTSLIQVGNEYDIYDTSNRSLFKIDSASSRVSGTITLDAALDASYSGGTSSSLKRNTLLISGNNRAEMENGLSGEIADTQCFRLQRILPDSLSNQTFKGMIGVNTNMIFEVAEVTDSDTIKVTDTTDLTPDIVSGRVFDVFETVYDADGNKHFLPRDLQLTVASSSFSTPLTTINTGTNTGIAVGDTIIMRHFDAAISLVTKNGEETFQTPTLDSVVVNDLGIVYPNITNIYSHWLLGGPTSAAATTNIKGSGQSLVSTGALTFNDSFLNGQFSTSGWTTSNYLSISNANALSGLTGNSGNGRLQFSFWVYYAGTNASSRFLVGMSNGSNNGYRLFVDGSTNNLRINVNTTGDLTLSNALVVGWNHVSLHILGGTSIYIYSNGVKSGSITDDPSTSGDPFTVGVISGSFLSPATSLKLADMVVWQGGPALTQGEIESLYNRGLHRVLTQNPGIEYRYMQAGMSGQKLTWKGTANRTTDDALVHATYAGAIKA